MKLETRDIQIEGDLSIGETHRFGFDPDALEALMEMMTDTYGDPILAVLRELSVNARDSHIEAGNPAPIIVSLPDGIEQELVIKDNGVGLDPADAVAVFTLYGKSTKRGSNKVTGMLGIGSKSPLAYCDAFTVIARKDGIQTTLLISKNEDDVGELEELIEPTDEPNGVEVRIPVRSEDYSTFENRAKWLFSFWKSPVLVNGERLDNQEIEGFTRLNDELAVSKPSDNWGNQSYIVMGDVPYRVPSETHYDMLSFFKHGEYLQAQRYMRKGERHNVKYVAWVPMGSVQFTPDRENLKMKQTTIDTLESLLAWSFEYLPRMIHDLAQDIPKKQVMSTYDNTSLLDQVRPHWHGIEVPRLRSLLEEYSHKVRITTNGSTASTIDQHVRSGGSVSISSGWYTTEQVFSDSSTSTFLYVDDYKPRSLTENYAYRVLRAAEQFGMDFDDLKDVAFFAGGPKQNAFIEFEHVLDWEWVKKKSSSIKKVRRPEPEVPPHKKLSVGYFKTRQDDGRFVDRVPVERLDKYKPIVYYHPSDKYNNQAFNNLYEMAPDVQVIRVYKNELKTFLKMQPGASHMKDAYAVLLDGTFDGMTYEDIFIAIGGGRYINHRLQGGRYQWGGDFYGKKIKDMDLSAMLDQELAECIYHYANGDRAVLRSLDFFVRNDLLTQSEYMKKIRNNYPDEHKRARAIITRIEEHYPLLQVATEQKEEALIEYVNAMYEYHKEN